MRTILSRNLLLLFVLAGAFLLASTVVCYHAVMVLERNQSAVEHTQAVLTQLEAVRASLALAEGRQRNYLVSGDESVVSEYEEAGRQSREEIDGLARLTADNPRQQVRVALLRESVGERLASLQEAMDRYRTDGYDAAREWVRQGSGRRAMDRSLGHIRSMEEAEESLLTSRSGESIKSLHRLVGTFALVATMNAGLLGAIVWSVRREVAARQEASRRIQESETRLLLAVEAAEVGIWDYDPASGRVGWSDRCYKLFEEEPGTEITYGIAVSHLHPDDRMKVARAVESAMDAGGTGRYRLEYRIVWRDGQVRHIRAYGRAQFEGEGEKRRAVRLAGTVQDITDSKRVEEDLRAAKEHAEGASKAKDQFLAVLSHELRTPLTPVLAAVSDMEQRKELPEGLRAEIATVRRNVELEAVLIDDLLDLTRIARGKVELHAEAVDVHALLRAVVGMIERDAKDKGVTVTTELGEGQNYVWGDPGRLQQVVWNLLGNAVKFTPPGGEVVVKTARDGAMVVMQVSDNGIGIDAELLPRLFDAFEQGERTIARRFGGLGLGLSIAKAIVTMHGGELTATSQGRDRGAAFTVRLKGVEAPGAREPVVETKPEVTPVAAAKKPGKMKILLVEDNEDTRRLMGRLLRSFGHQVESADCVASAMELAGREMFDLLLSDIGLPDGTGWELMGKLGERKPPRAIALSGFGMAEDVRKSLDAGFVEHMIKPVNVGELRAAIERVGASV